MMDMFFLSKNLWHVEQGFFSVDWKKTHHVTNESVKENALSECQMEMLKTLHEESSGTGPLVMTTG